jgi:hypothetical protein
MVAMAHLPVLVVGSPATCAARFIARFGLGETVPYDQPAVAAALGRLNAPATQSEIRARAATLAAALTAEGSADWIWRSLDAGKPIDERYETLMPPDRAA